MLDVKKALTIAPLTRSRVVAGHDGLDRLIKNITIMEVPDLLQWLKGNDFVITSLFCIKDNPQAQVKLVEDMARFDCAALAIKSDRYVKTLPAGMIDLRCLPLATGNSKLSRTGGRHTDIAPSRHGLPFVPAQV